MERKKLKLLVCALAIGLSVSLANAQDGMGGPMAHWMLDDGSGTTATDSSGNGNDGTLVGAEWKTTGGYWVGTGALEFGGDGDRVEIAENETADPNMSTLSQITVASWVNLTATTGYPWGGDYYQGR